MNHKIAKLRIRGRMIESRETFVIWWPFEDCIALCLKTGHIDVAAGKQFNDRGEVTRTFDRFERFVR